MRNDSTNETPENKVKEAVDVVRKALREDEGYYLTWQSNIAVAFQDCLARAGYKLPDQHKISNDAAKEFLSNLLRESP